MEEGALSDFLAAGQMAGGGRWAIKPRIGSNVQRVYPASVGVDLRMQDSRHRLIETDLACAVTGHHCTFPQLHR
ncbi:hypothetical protein EYF80_022778 [Liparis tanakae]|uniref:Uncharacterized protein n=1 Tax=Liparis tanakae TaxID=230148 RepID=A0A4Z2HP14_9TELE|nr:hypothetical protein EYF80_022778 [Liparis tanakae]